jgi:hypothetical protein
MNCIITFSGVGTSSALSAWEVAVAGSVSRMWDGTYRQGMGTSSHAHCSQCIQGLQQFGERCQGTAMGPPKAVGVTGPVKDAEAALATGVAGMTVAEGAVRAAVAAQAEGTAEAAGAVCSLVGAMPEVLGPGVSCTPASRDGNEGA